MIFNPDAEVRCISVGRENLPVLVIDDPLTSPQTLVEYAASDASFAAVKEADNYYPGVRAPAPQQYARGLVEYLRPLIESRLGVPTCTLLAARCALSIAAMPPESLTLAQSLPHFDTVDEMQIAAVHYFCEPHHGGLGFYRHRKSGFEAITRQRAQEYAKALNDDLRQNGRPQPGYVTGDNALFERTCSIDAGFNRLIVYRSNMLHSGAVNAACLSNDPRKGRLTATLFARFQKLR
ncbi:MAG: DUF6445 family protein [Pseudomonadota bacterium]|nr:DUF6445 family protein [Pseudomonadota bacterium]